MTYTFDGSKPEVYISKHSVYTTGPNETRKILKYPYMLPNSLNASHEQLAKEALMEPDTNGHILHSRGLVLLFLTVYLAVSYSTLAKTSLDDTQCFVQCGQFLPGRVWRRVFAFRGIGEEITGAEDVTM